MRRTGIALGLGLALTCSLCAQAPEIAWEDNFDDPNCLSGAQFYVSHANNRQAGWNDGLLIKELKDGVVRYGVRPDKSRIRDYVHLAYGNVSGQIAPPWGPFDLKRYPIVEIKWRGSFLEIDYNVESASGKKRNDYVQWVGDPNEWNTTVWRVATDTSVPGPETAVKLVGIDPLVFTPPPGTNWNGVLEIDYIRVRGFTAEEAAKEAEVVEVLGNFPKGRWRGFDDFFPWGVYEGYLRGVFESWGGDYEGAYGNYSRHHFNYIPCNDEVEIGRCGMDPERYIGQMQALINSARATGMRLGADIQRMTGMEYEDALSIMKQLVKAFADDDVVVSWKVYDEPGVNKLVQVAKIIRAIREADPLKRPELMEFNSTAKFGAYVPYLNLACLDHYAIKENSRDPWSIRQQVKDYRELLPDKPIWVLLPAFEGLPPVADGYFARPSDAEFRMMTYLAVAEGAKGVMWFIGWYSASDFVGLVDRTGLPRGGMMDTLSELGARIVPVGKQLLATDPVEDSQIKVVQLVEPNESSHLVQVSALKHRTDNIHFLVAVNEDLDRPRSAKVGLPRAILNPGADQGVYDLHTLDGKNLAKSGGRIFTVAPLAGGDGRFYAVCDEGAFQKIRASILCETALEDVRVLRPDMSIALRWGLDLSEVNRAIESCHISAQGKLPDQAAAEARLAKSLLFDKIRNDSELNVIRRALSDMQKELAETSPITEYFSREPKWWTGGDHETLIPNPGILELSKRYWQVGRSYRDCYAKYLAGDKNGLWEKVNEARYECLNMRVEVLGFLREKLKPAAESPVQNPKEIQQ